MLSFLFSFRGRISRSSYWVCSFLRFPVYGALAGVIHLVEESGLDESDWTLLLWGPMLLAVLYAETAIAAKRLHDTNRSGWCMLWGLVPILGAIYLLVVCGFLRDPKPNEYGDPPESVVILLIKNLLSCIPLIPKALWRFTLNRVRELGKAFRGED